MAAAPVPPFVSLYEYLHSDYQPDLDYVDGVLEERNLGENEHSSIQTELTIIFGTHRNEWQVKTYVEQRVQITPTRFRVPDVCVMPTSWKRTPIIQAAPLLCIEVLSPEDRLSRTLTRAQDYFLLGTSAVWIFDPVRREVLVLQPDGAIRNVREGILTLDGTPIAVSLAELFAVLDEE